MVGLERSRRQWRPEDGLETCTGEAPTGLVIVGESGGPGPHGDGGTSRLTLQLLARAPGWEEVSDSDGEGGEGADLQRTADSRAWFWTREI